MFDWVTREARARHWYIEGRVPDTIEGRFAMLATIAALVILRLERGGTRGIEASVALTERFVEVMESEHREMGLGDPKLGRTVRKLVSGLRAASRCGAARSQAAAGSKPRMQASMEARSQPMHWIMARPHFASSGRELTRLPTRR